MAEPDEETAYLATPVAAVTSPVEGDGWTKLRCKDCRTEANIRTASLPLLDLPAARDDDGVRLALCAKCV